MRSFLIISLSLTNICLAKKKVGLRITTVFKPDACSETAANGDTVAVHYTGKLENGQIFDSSVVAKRDPIKFQLGMGKVIQGWEKGILGMCIGEKRKLVIPPDLAYGPEGVKGVIPPQATLTFDTELMELQKKQMMSVLSEDGIKNLLSFAMWPIIVLAVLFALYNRVQVAEEKTKSERSEKKSRKKKH